ncbi:MAG: hypothetical protein IPL73_23575 [Candidatus Obscuribacter sp.]|nr:hypothetical protein [Candidatus Obscuribacter sp.]
MLSRDLVEKVARRAIRPIWDDMKVRALQCSARAGEMSDGHSADEKSASANYPGATVTIDRLKKYVDAHPGEVEINLVSHSAGSIYSVGVLARMQDAGLKVHNLVFLAPAIRVCDYQMFIAPKLSAKMIDKVAIFNLSEYFEENDLSSIKGIAYPHSLLYLVARALESPGVWGIRGTSAFTRYAACSNKPLSVISDATPADVLKSNMAVVVNSSSSASKEQSKEASSRLASTATSHGGFGDDRATLESIALLLQQ